MNKPKGRPRKSTAAFARAVATVERCGDVWAHFQAAHAAAVASGARGPAERAVESCMDRFNIAERSRVFGKIRGVKKDLEPIGALGDLSAQIRGALLAATETRALLDAAIAAGAIPADVAAEMDSMSPRAIVILLGLIHKK